MKIKAISDTHTDAHQLELGSGDILIHAGDACTKGNYTEGLNFLWWFVKQNYKYKVAVWGNHDQKLKSHAELISLARDMGIVVLSDDLVEIEGLKIYGVNKVFCDEAKDNPSYNPKLSVRAKAWENIPKNIDILVTHLPPKNILDTNLSDNPIGCSQLTKKIFEVSPKLHLFGHAHLHGGKVAEKNGTKFYNCAVKDEQYLTVRYRGIDIEF